MPLSFQKLPLTSKSHGVPRRYAPLVGSVNRSMTEGDRGITP